MPGILFVVFVLVAGLWIRDKFGYKWRVDRLDATHTDDVVGASIVDPIKVRGNMVGFDLLIANRTDDDIVVDWAESLYTHNGTAMGGFVFADVPQYIQAAKSNTRDCIPTKGKADRRILPAALLRNDEFNARPYVKIGEETAGVEIWERHQSVRSEPLGEGEHQVLLDVRKRGEEKSRRITLTLRLVKEKWSA